MNAAVVKMKTMFYPVLSPTPSPHLTPTQTGYRRWSYCSSPQYLVMVDNLVVFHRQLVSEVLDQKSSHRARDQSSIRLAAQFPAIIKKNKKHSYCICYMYININGRGRGGGVGLHSCYKTINVIFLFCEASK